MSRRFASDDFRWLWIVCVLIAATSGCRGPLATVFVAGIPSRYEVSQVSATGAGVVGTFSLASNQTRSPMIEGVSAVVSVSGARIGTFELVRGFRLAAGNASSAELRGQLSFGSLTRDVYRSFFEPEVMYRLSGESRLSFLGIGRKHPIEGAGRLAFPKEVSLVFTDGTVATLVRLDSARLDAEPSEVSPVGVTLLVTVTNPLAFPLRVRAAHFDVKSGNQTLLSAESRRPLDLQAGENQFTLRTLLQPVRGLAQLARRFVEGKDLGVSTSGSVILEESGKSLVVQLRSQ